MTKTYPSQEYLHRLIDYDPLVGDCIWKERSADMFKGGRYSKKQCCITWNKRFAGKKAGALSPKGYIRIGINGTSFRAHQLIWIYMTGERSGLLIDHIDMNKINNKWNNLRQATNSQNLANRNHNRNSVLGIKGVSMRKGKYIARVMKDGKAHHLGTFETTEDASATVKIASEILFGEFAR